MASLVESADTSINTLEGKTAALETHSSIVDASIIDVYEGITYLESLHGLSLLTTIDISNNLDTLNLRASNTDASMIRAFELMNDISNIDNVFDFYDISRDLISLASLVESADTSINTLEGKTAALETHSSIVDASIIDVYEGITLVQTIAGLQQSNINTLDTSVNTLETNVAVLDESLNALHTHNLIVNNAIGDLFSKNAFMNSIISVESTDILNIKTRFNILLSYLIDNSSINISDFSLNSLIWT